MNVKYDGIVPGVKSIKVDKNGNGSKICTMCMERKPLSKFPKNKNKVGGFDSWCKKCSCKSQKEWHKKDNGALRRKYLLKKTYGITRREYDDIYNKQGGRCAICGEHQVNMKRKLAVDHCHKTDTIRGLLCSKCNPGIGYFNDDIELLESAISYLRGKTNETAPDL